MYLFQEVIDRGADPDRPSWRNRRERTPNTPDMTDNSDKASYKDKSVTPDS